MVAWRKSLLALLAIPLASWSGPRLTASARAIGSELATSLAPLGPSTPPAPSLPIEPAAPGTPSVAPGYEGDLLDGRPLGEGDDAGRFDALSKPGTPSVPRGGGAKPSKHSGRSVRDARATHSVFVSEHTIVRLANARVVPTGQSVPGNASRPAGIALTGVGALGIGLRDGDVLTEVGGRPAHAEGQVIAAILVSLTRHDRQISGVFYRGADRWLLVVELPIVRLPESAPVVGSSETVPARDGR